MKIDNDHLYHGAALIQIAEHGHFTAINPLRVDNRTLRGAYRVNDTTGLFLKYCTAPRKPHDEYMFTFNRKRSGIRTGWVERMDTSIVQQLHGLPPG